MTSTNVDDHMSLAWSSRADASFARFEICWRYTYIGASFSNVISQLQTDVGCYLFAAFQQIVVGTTCS